MTENTKQADHQIMRILVVILQVLKVQEVRGRRGGVMKQTFTSTNTYSVSHATMVYYNGTTETFVKVEFIKKMTFICAYM